MNETETQKVDVHISFKAWSKVKILLDMFDYEFCFILKVINNEGNLTIDDIIVQNQNGCGVHTRMLQESLDGFQFDIMQKKTNDVKMEELKGWGHSHVNMDVFESSDDVDTSRNTFGSQAMRWCLSMVVNKKNKCLLRMYLFDPYQDMRPCNLIVDYPKWEGEAAFREACKGLIAPRTSEAAEFFGPPRNTQSPFKVHGMRRGAAAIAGELEIPVIPPMPGVDFDDKTMPLFDEYELIERAMTGKNGGEFNGFPGIDSGESRFSNR